MERVLAIQNHDGLCWKCLQSYDESKIHNIKIPEMGYGSQFDGELTEIHLCDDCYQESIKENSELWSMEEIQCDFDKEDNCGFYEYKYEQEMLDYIHNLPIEGRQFVQNEFSEGASACWTMDAQDWIDYQLDMLPHDKCKEYMMYSLDEIKAYEERFPTCQYPANRIWSDDSKDCWCPFGASGDYGQETGCNISEECYQCPYYTKRTTPILDIKDENFEGYEIDVKYTIRHADEFQEVLNQLQYQKEAINRLEELQR